MFLEVSALNSRRSSNSRTSSRPPSDARALEIDSQRRVERELKGLVLFLTHWVEASEEFVLPSQPHEYWRWLDHTATYTDFKKEMRDESVFLYQSHIRVGSRASALFCGDYTSPHFTAVFEANFYGYKDTFGCLEIYSQSWHGIPSASRCSWISMASFTTGT
jgi:hypothetical protein